MITVVSINLLLTFKSVAAVKFDHLYQHRTL